MLLSGVLQRRRSEAKKDRKNVSQKGSPGRDEDGTLLGALLSSFSF